MNIKNSIEFRRRSIAAFCTAAIVAGALVLPSIELLCSNQAEFTFSLRQLLLINSLIMAGAILILWSLLMFFRNPKHFDTMNALLLATGSAVWLQYTFFSRIIPELSLEQFAITPFLLLIMLFNLLLLILPFALILWQKKWCSQHCWQLALIILAPQILPAAWQLATYTKPNYDFFEYSISEERKFTFAKEENIILLVVDAMGEYIFRQVWQNYPELQLSLKDFTCFDRMISQVPGTSYAVPAMLSGINYPGNHLKDGEWKHAEYLKTACWSENSLFLNFKKLGYHTDAYPFILQTICYSPELLDNTVIRNDHQQSKQLFLDILFSRMTPLFLKPLLKNSYLFLTDPFVTPLETNTASQDDPHDLIFYQQLENKATTGDFRKGLKYLHLQGAHAFIRTDENLEYSYNTDVVRQLRGSLKNLELLVEKMKELGIYDQALIIVTGDHSERYTPEIVTLIKRPFETHEQMQFNSLPGKISDLAGTVLAEKKLRPFQMSLFSYPPVISTGETRLSVLPTFLTIENWSKNADHADPLQNNSATEVSFSIKDKQICIPVNGNRALPASIVFLAKNLHNNELWQTENKTLDKNALPPNFYQLALQGLPDGDYILFQIGKYFRETASVWDGTSVSEDCDIFYLPHFLMLRNGLPSFSKRYPGITPRPIRINEKVVFEAMKPYPQLLIPNDSIRTKYGLRVKENSILEIFLPQAEKPLALQIDVKIFTPNGVILELYNDNQLLHAQEVSPTNHAFFPVEFFLPENLPENRKLNLQFRIVRKFKNREKRTAYKILLSSLQLKEV